MALFNVKASFTLLDGDHRVRHLRGFDGHNKYPSFVVHFFKSPLHERHGILVATSEWKLPSWQRTEECIQELKTRLEEEGFFIQRLKVSFPIPETAFSLGQIGGQKPLYLLVTQVLCLPEAKTPELLEICRENGLFVVYDSLSLMGQGNNKAWHISKRFECEDSDAVSKARSGFIAIVAETVEMGIVMPRDPKLEYVVRDNNSEEDDKLIVPCEFTPC